MSLIDMRLLERQEGRKVRPPNVYYVTDLTSPCMREMFYSVRIDRAYPIETLRLFEAGNMFEDYWIDLLATTEGYRLLGRQLPAYHYLEGEDAEIHGRLDALMQHSDNLVVGHEVKSQKSLYYLNGQPKDDHIEQLNFYLVKQGLQHGQVDYLDKANALSGEGPVDQSYPVEPDLSLFSKTVGTCLTLHGFNKSNRLPPRTDCWKCGKDRSGKPYCLYKAECEADRHPDECKEASA